VMTALPMRVISDSPERTVLYLAPDTAFKGADPLRNQSP
jgi:hypothetical protein